MANLAKKHIQGTLGKSRLIKQPRSYFLIKSKAIGNKKTYGHDFARDKGVVISESISVK